MGGDVGTGVHADDHGVQAVDNFGGIRELVSLGKQLGHAQVSETLVEDGPDGAMTVHFADQRKQQVIGKQALRTTGTHIQQFLEGLAVAECGGAGIEEYKKNVACALAAAKGVKLVTVGL